MSDSTENLYKLRGDVLESLLDRVHKDLSEIVNVMEATRSALKEQDKKFQLTSNGGGLNELYTTVRKNFPKFENASDEEIAEAFGGKK